MLRRNTDPLGKCLTQDDELGLGPNSLYYDLTGGIQSAMRPRTTSDTRLLIGHSEMQLPRANAARVATRAPSQVYQVSCGPAPLPARPSRASLPGELRPDAAPGQVEPSQVYQVSCGPAPLPARPSRAKSTSRAEPSLPGELRPGAAPGQAEPSQVYQVSCARRRSRPSRAELSLPGELRPGAAPGQARAEPRSTR
ncbi:hypothetical protein ACJJTC_014786 [Scirpophaga incertulas]